MSLTEAGVEPASGGIESVASIIHELRGLVQDVGPEWGLVLVVAICVFLPRYGVIVQLAALFAADREDKRKRKLDSERLLRRYRNRPQKPPQRKLPPPVAKLPPPRD